MRGKKRAKPFIVEQPEKPRLVKGNRSSQTVMSAIRLEIDDQKGPYPWTRITAVETITNSLGVKQDRTIIITLTAEQRAALISYFM